MDPILLTGMHDFNFFHWRPPLLCTRLQLYVVTKCEVQQYWREGVYRMQCLLCWLRMRCSISESRRQLQLVILWWHVQNAQQSFLCHETGMLSMQWFNRTNRVDFLQGFCVSHPSCGITLLINDVMFAYLGFAKFCLCYHERLWGYMKLLILF